MPIQLKSLLQEALQDYYHATDIFSFNSMLKDNAIKLTFAGGTQVDLDLNKGKLYFLSMMRVKYGRYAGGPEGKSLYYNVVLHLNGRKLSANYEIYPVDYWGMGRASSEQEDRLVSDKDELKPLNRYIIDVHIYVGKIDHEPTIRKLYEIDELSKKQNIPVYYYKTGQEQEFRLQRKEKAFTDIKQAFPKYPEETPEDKEFRQNREKYQKDKGAYIREFLNIYNNKPPEDKTRYDMVEKWLKYYPRDAVTQISNDVHNYKKEHLPIFRELRDAIRKEKLHTLKELIELVIKRFHDQWLATQSDDTKRRLGYKT